MSADPANTTRLVRAVRDGDAAAAEELLPLVYDELRSIAARLMKNERPDHTLQPTALIHEAWARLVGGAEHGDREGWRDRVHFTRVAARAMRFVLVDRVRRKFTHKRGDGRRKVTLDDDLAARADTAENAALVLTVHDGLEQLAEVDPQLAQIVELRFFGGLSIEEAAEALGVSRQTVIRGWRTARAWWLREFADGA